jgi:fumarate reductase subunit C
MSAVRPDKSKLYYPKMANTWWLRRMSYFLFMLRELSSVFIALFLMIYLAHIYQLTKGPFAYIAFGRKFQSPGWIAFHAVVLVFALYHTYTWFASSAVVLPIKIGDRFLPRNAVILLNIAAWMVVSLVIASLFIWLQGVK